MKETTLINRSLIKTVQRKHNKVLHNLYPSFDMTTTSPYKATSERILQVFILFRMRKSKIKSYFSIHDKKAAILTQKLHDKIYCDFIVKTTLTGTNNG